MLLRVTRSRLEGEASVGRGPRLRSSKEEAHSNCVSNVTISHRGDLGGLGHTQLKFNSVSRRHQLPLPQGKAACDNVVTLTSTRCASVVRVASSSGSCCQKEVAWKMPQLSLRKLFGAYKREKPRRGGAVGIEPGCGEMVPRQRPGGCFGPRDDRTIARASVSLSYKRF